MREKFEYFFVVFIIKLSKALPIKFTYKIFELLGLLLFYTLKSRRNLAISNLQKALNLEQKKAYQTAKETFLSIAKTACESILIYNDKFDFEKNINNKELIKNLFIKLSKLHKSTLLITAHFGNWEALSHYAAKIGYSQLIIAREGNNQLIETKLTKPSRQKFGNILAYKHEAMSKMIKHIKKGGFVGLLPDLNSSKDANSVKCSFFGMPCYTIKSVASLVLKYNVPVVAVFLRRKDDGSYDPIIKELEFELSGDNEIDTKNIVQTCNDVIQSVITSAPHQWFWVHNRWKNGDE